ncbi:MAG: aspartate aminotransferase family protein, partial [Pseudodonghicola sp.]
PAGQLGAKMAGYMLENGLISRAMGDALAFCPPMIITEAEVKEMLDIASKSLEQLTAEILG